MSRILFLFIYLLGHLTFASLDSRVYHAKVVRFDAKNVTLQIAGENYKLNREKLGPEFSKLKVNETIEIEVSQKDLKK